MTHFFRNAGLALVAATTIATSATVPAMAGERERDFLKGVAAAAIVGAIVNDIKQDNRKRQQQQYVPVQRYYTPEPVYVQPRQPVYTQPRSYAPSVYSVPAAQTFNDYSARDKRAIQSELARYGYYRGSIDGVWGPGTYRAVQAYARDTGQGNALESRRSAYSFYDNLILG